MYYLKVRDAGTAASSSLETPGTKFNFVLNVVAEPADLPTGTSSYMYMYMYFEPQVCTGSLEIVLLPEFCFLLFAST